jgi:beta-glucanase (GH16 family)
MSRRAINLLLTASLALLLAESSPAAKPAPLSDPDGRWNLVDDYSDEFNAKQLDLRKWNSDYSDWGDWSWEPENVRLVDGCAEITMRYQPHTRKGRRLFYTSGNITTRAKLIRYGYFEARVRGAARQPGVCPAFWVFKNTPERWTEIDFFELTQVIREPKRVYFNTHVFRLPDIELEEPLRESRSWVAPWNPADDFHVYGCLWEKDRIRWYVDGKLRAERANRYWHQPLQMVLSLGLRRPLKTEPAAKGFPTSMHVDYVRVWKRRGE